MIIAIDLFGTIIPEESDVEAHQLLSKCIAEVHGFRDSWKDLYELYREAHSVCGDSNRAVVDAYRKFIVLNNVEPLYTYEELTWMHIWTHIELGKPYPDVYPFLEKACRRAKLVLITDTVTPIARGILRFWDLEKYFHSVVATHSYGLKKSDPETVELVKMSLGVENLVPMYVLGDSFRDYEFAKNANAVFIAIARRREVMERFQGYNVAIAKDLLEALELIKL